MGHGSTPRVPKTDPKVIQRSTSQRAVDIGQKTIQRSTSQLSNTSAKHHSDKSGSSSGTFLPESSSSHATTSRTKGSSESKTATSSAGAGSSGHKSLHSNRDKPLPVIADKRFDQYTRTRDISLRSPISATLYPSEPSLVPSRITEAETESQPDTEFSEMDWIPYDREPPSSLYRSRSADGFVPMTGSEVASYMEIPPRPAGPIPPSTQASDSEFSMAFDRRLALTSHPSSRSHPHSRLRYVDPELEPDPDPDIPEAYSMDELDEEPELDEIAVQALEAKLEAPSDASFDYDSDSIPIVIRASQSDLSQSGSGSGYDYGPNGIGRAYAVSKDTRQSIHARRKFAKESQNPNSLRVPLPSDPDPASIILTELEADALQAKLEAQSALSFLDSLGEVEAEYEGEAEEFGDEELDEVEESTEGTDVGSRSHSSRTRSGRDSGRGYLHDLTQHVEDETHEFQSARESLEFRSSTQSQYYTAPEPSEFSAEGSRSRRRSKGRSWAVDVDAANRGSQHTQSDWPTSFSASVVEERHQRHSRDSVRYPPEEKEEEWEREEMPSRPTSPRTLRRVTRINVLSSSPNTPRSGRSEESIRMSDHSAVTKTVVGRSESMRRKILGRTRRGR